MRTALITLANKQQIVLQPDNLREHRVLQMLKQKNADIQVLDSDLQITEQGNIRAVNEPLFYNSPEKPESLIIQVQDAAPFSPDPNLISMTKEELADVLSLLPVSQALETWADAFIDSLVYKRAKSRSISRELLGS